MKRKCKTIAIIILCLACLPLVGCFYSFEESSDGRFIFGVSDMKKDAFCIGCEWSGGDKEFVIPDEFMGYKVTTLGGYTGRGYPCPFAVHVDLSEIYPGDGTDFCQKDIDGYQPEDEYDVLTFSIHLGANLTELDYLNGKMYIVRHIEKEDGSVEEDVLCKIAYSFTVDEANPKLYAENGKLYYRDGNTPVTEFFYE